MAYYWVFWKVLCCPWTFSKVVPNIVSLLREWHSALALGIFSISETKRIKHNTVSIQYISINFDRTFNSKKSHNSLFLRDTTLRARKVLKELPPYINVQTVQAIQTVRYFTFHNRLRFQLRATLENHTVVFTKICSFN